MIGCVPGDVLTVLGDNFAGVNISNIGLQVQLYYGGDIIACAKPVPLSASSLLCTLPWLPIGGDSTVLPIRVSGIGSRPSNWLLAVGYAQTIPSVVLSSSSGSEGTGSGGGGGGVDDASPSYYRSFVVSIAILLPLSLLSLAIAGYLLYKQWRVRQSSSDASPLNATRKGSELSDALQLSDRS